MTPQAKTLASKYREHILAQDEPVSMEYLIERSTGKGNSLQMTLKALQFLHRYKDIAKTTRKDDAWYSQAVEKVKTVGYKIPWKDYPKRTDKNQCQHPIFDNMDYHALFLTPEEMQIEKWKAERAFTKSLDS